MLAIIPARSGSKGIKNKNLRIIDNKSLLEWTLSTAEKSKKITKILISTDCKKIQKIGKNYSKVISFFLRPKELAKDTSIVTDAIVYSLAKLKKNYNIYYENFVVLQPTSPLLEASDIDKAINKYFKFKTDSLVSVSECLYPPNWCTYLDKKDRIKLIDYQIMKLKNRQDLKKTFYFNGAIRILSTKFFLRKKNYFSKKTIGFCIPQYKGIDIDTHYDLELTRLVAKKKNKFKKLK
jgi:CMP-N,N'-diacetyllegionaminic acid synthase